ncbi:hypothetical protein TNCV_423951 [Trichonephila clavipes]|nr:hypothetical protein TNCV_423951 [Trichonephila clavipes]
MSVENKVLLNTTVLRPIMTYACPVTVNREQSEFPLSTNSKAGTFKFRNLFISLGLCQQAPHSLSPFPRSVHQSGFSLLTQDCYFRQAPKDSCDIGCRVSSGALCALTSSVVKV